MRKTLLSLFAMLMVVLSASADECVFKGTGTPAYVGTASVTTWTSELWTKSVLKNNVATLQWSAGVSDASSLTYINWQGTNTLTITPAEGITISKITFQDAASNGGGANTFYMTVDASTGTTSNDMDLKQAYWTGSVTNANPLVLSKVGASRISMSYILIEYEKQGKVEEPVVQPIPGSYLIGQEVSMTAEENAVITYSTSVDGSPEMWQTYTEPFKMETVGEWVIKAKATINGVDSDIFTGNYTIGNTVSEEGVLVLDSRARYSTNTAVNAYKYAGEDPSLVFPEDVSDNTVTADGVMVASWTPGAYTWQTSFYGAATNYFSVSANAELTLSPVPGVKVTKVQFFIAGASQMQACTASSGQFTAYADKFGASGTSATWEGSAAGAVTFTFGKAQTMLSYMIVTYEVNKSVEVVPVAVPVITPEAGTYKVGQEITITPGQEGTNIQYSASLDGSEKWMAYEKPFALEDAGNWTVKARAYKGASPSEVVTVNYTIEYLDVAAPVIYPQAGTVAADQLISISAVEGAEIQYSATNDGSENWKKYTAPFSLNAAGTWTVKAKAYVGISPSPVAEAVYTIAKSSAGLSFEKDAYTAVITQNFASPVLNNPNELAVVWASSDPAVATVENGVVTTLSAGETTISATFDGNNAFEAGSAQYVLTVDRMVPSFSFSAPYTWTVGYEMPELPTLNNPQELAVSWKSTNTDVAVVTKNGDVTILGQGVTNIVATATQTDLYKGVDAEYTLTVFPENCAAVPQSADIVIQDYFSRAWVPSTEAESTEMINDKTYLWKDMLFHINPYNGGAYVIYNYRGSMMGNQVNSQLRFCGTQMEMTAPAGGTFTKIVFNMSQTTTQPLITADSGEVKQVKAGNTVVWEGDASSVNFTFGGKNQFGYNDNTNALGNFYFSSIDVEYNQLVIVDESELYVEMAGESYVDGQTIEAAPGTTMTVYAPSDVQETVASFYYEDGTIAETYSEAGNRLVIPLESVGTFDVKVQGFASGKTYEANYKVVVANTEKETSAIFDFNVDNFGMDLGLVDDFGNAGERYSLKKNDVTLTVPATEQTGLIDIVDVKYLQVENGSYFLLTCPADRRIVSIELTGTFVDETKVATLNAEGQTNIIGAISGGVWTAQGSKDFREIAVLSDNTIGNSVNIETVKVVTNVATGVAEVAAQAGEAEVYTLDGMRVSSDNLQPGVYVIRSNGQVRKVIVK